MQTFWHRFEQIHHHQRRAGKKLNLQKSDDENARAHGSEELERVLDKVHASEEENRRLRREVDELSIKLQRRKVNKRLSSIKNQKQHEKGEEDEEDFFNYDSLPLYSEYVKKRQRQRTEG
jgi:spore cortex formation protein SpoVR/YcgB (stage V sporulation)